MHADTALLQRNHRHSRAQRATSLPRSEADSAIEYLNALMRRVSGASMEDIDRVILDLESVRARLRNEGRRVSREVADYESLSHAVRQ